MELSHQECIRKNKQEYGSNYRLLHWLNEKEVSAAEKKRKGLFDLLSTQIKQTFKDTKPFYGQLSPGCLKCGQGKWSCLFINNICNAFCFFCPTEQKEISDPYTNTVAFPNPEDYLDYLQKFEFTGVSLSGGEPLLTLKRTLLFAGKIKKRFGSRIHLWIYTNGLLITQDILKQLQDIGLNEIRFNIAASDYDLEKVKMAVGSIDKVTVEIPAVPEDQTRLKDLIRHMSDFGVDFLNLHQIRLTPCNFKNLQKRKYTFLHGPKITILESEWTALETIRFAIENRIHLPINYCSFIYKRRFQISAARKKYAALMKKSYEDIAETGMIRSIFLMYSQEEIETCLKIIQEKNISASLWYSDTAEKRFYFHPDLFDLFWETEEPIYLNYYSCSIKSAPSYTNVFQKIGLNPSKQVILERSLVGKERLNSRKKKSAFKKLLSKQAKYEDPAFKIFPKVLVFEKIKSGLYEYY